MAEPNPQLIEALTMAIFHGFWEGDSRPPSWSQTPEYQRVQFRIMARRAIQAAKLFKAEPAKPTEAAISTPHGSEREAA